jgi:hypothetical protein
MSAILSYGPHFPKSLMTLIGKGKNSKGIKLSNMLEIVLMKMKDGVL